MFPEPLFFGRWFEVMIRTIELCHSIETSLLVFHVLCREEYNYTPKEVPKIYDFLEEVVHQGKKKGVTLLLENLNKGCMDGEYSCTIRNLVGTFGTLDVGYCIDISHTALTQQDIVEEISLAGSRLMSVHVSNTCGRQDIHALPSEGVVDWHLVRQAFLSSGYKGKFVLEINGLDNPDRVFQEICKLFDINCK